MTRLGPLTALALGRSPYDDVVWGTGEEDSNAPPQSYDNRGRPVNQATRTLNRDIIRAHNEVMQVIGVAEPDNDASMPDRDSLIRYIEFEEKQGYRVLRLGRILEIGGVWGVNGLRARILLYKRYADIKFFRLFQHEKESGSVPGLLLAGFPSFLAGHALKIASSYWTAAGRSRWGSRLLSVIRVHLQVWVFLQRTEIISAWKLFPPLTFFIPGHSTSPVPAPDLPKEFSLPSVMRYLGSWCMNAAPFAMFALSGYIWKEMTLFLWREIQARLPSTLDHNRASYNVALAQAARARAAAEQQQQQQQEQGAEGQRSHTPVEEPVRQPVDLPPQDRSEVLRDINAQEEGAASGANSSSNDHNPSSQDNQGSLNSNAEERTANDQGNDYYSDEDEEETGMSATLISFDVEATDAADAPPGVWSAELRPSAGAEALSAVQLAFADTMLTRLPALLAADIFTVITAYIVVSPYEAFALRLMARSWCARMGLPTSAIHELNIFSGFTLKGLANFVGLEFIHLTIATEVWAAVSLLSQVLHLTEEEWKYCQQKRKEERQAERERRQNALLAEVTARAADASQTDAQDSQPTNLIQEGSAADTMDEGGPD